MHIANSLFVYPAIESEVQSGTKNVEGNSSAGYDEIPKLFVKQCIHDINASFNSGIFPDKMKIAQVKYLFKKVDRKMSKMKTNIHFMGFF